MFKFIWRFFPWMIVVILTFCLWLATRDFINPFRKTNPVITISQTTILQQVESLGKVELVKYHFKDVIEFEKKDYAWLPSSKVVLIAGGEAVGCIDLSKVRQEDLSRIGDTLLITLPEPELCYFKINHENSKVYDLEYTYFQDKTLIDQAYKEAEQQLRKAALGFNILAQTRDNAEIILKPVLEKITGKTVILSYPINNDIKRKQ